jgi:hypothetical protein
MATAAEMRNSSDTIAHQHEAQQAMHDKSCVHLGCLLLRAPQGRGGQGCVALLTPVWLALRVNEATSMFLVQSQTYRGSGP